MSLFCRSVTFITIECDLCRSIHRCHEAQQNGDLGEFLRREEKQAEKSLPREWVILRDPPGGGAKKYVCPKCVGGINALQKERS